MFSTLKPERSKQQQVEASFTCNHVRQHQRRDEPRVTAEQDLGAMVRDDVPAPCNAPPSAARLNAELLRIAMRAVSTNNTSALQSTAG